MFLSRRLGLRSLLCSYQLPLLSAPREDTTNPAVSLTTLPPTHYRTGPEGEGGRAILDEREIINERVGEK